MVLIHTHTDTLITAALPCMVLAWRWGAVWGSVAVQGHFGHVASKSQDQTTNSVINESQTLSHSHLV